MSIGIVTPKETRWRRWLALLAAGLCVTAGSGEVRGAEQADPDSIQAYSALVLRYAAGENAAAAGDAKRLTPVELRRRLDWLASLKKNADENPSEALNVPWCGLCSARDAWDRFPLRSAVLMHGEATWPTAGPNWLNHQLSMALNLADFLPDRQGGERFAIRFFLAVGCRLQQQGNLERARNWGQEGLKRFPRDPMLLLYAGTVAEAIGSLPIDEGAPDRTRKHVMQARHRLAREQRAGLEDATRLFERALKMKSDLREAQLRLGRVQWRRGRPADAERTFREVLAGESEVDVRYLAHLFLGRVQEDAQRHADAAKSYRAALALDPGAQTALLALSHVLYRLGEDRESRDAVERGLTLVDRRQRIDAFRAYPRGHALSFREAWESLRADARAEAES